MMAALLLILAGTLPRPAAAAPPAPRCNPEEQPAHVSIDVSGRPPPAAGKAKLLTLAQLPGQERVWPAALDGSPYAFYQYGGSSSRWTIYLQGGGWCNDELDCLCRSKTGMGSSAKLAPTWSAQTDCYNPLPDGSVDPNCNYIGLPYLDGASFSGYRPEPWPVPGSNETLTFRGLANLDATLDYAFNHLGLNKATEVILRGVSAGGLATYLHADRVSAAIRARAPSARVTALPTIGFFLDHDNFHHTDGYPGGPNTAPWSPPIKAGSFPAPATAANYSMWMQYIYQMQNLTFGSDGALSPTCEAKHPADPHLCFMAPHMVDTIKTPLFVLNSRFDEWQLVNIFQAPWDTAAEQAGALAYGDAFLEQFKPVMDSAVHGGIIGTCICHCPPTAAASQGNASTPFERLYADWYYGHTKGGSDSIYIDRSLPNRNGTYPTRTGSPKGPCYPFPGGDSASMV